MIKITIEREGEEPIVIECEQYVLRAHIGKEVHTNINACNEFLSASAMYINELARKRIIDETEGK